MNSLASLLDQSHLFLNGITVREELVVFRIPALSAADVLVVGYKFNLTNPFHQLKAEFVFATQTKWRAVQNASWFPIHLIRENRCLMPHVLNRMRVPIKSTVVPLAE